MRKSEQNEELGIACRDVWALAVRKGDLPWDKVGVHIWTQRGFKGIRHLQRRATFTVQKRRATHVTWRKGTGAIGMCWEDGMSYIADVSELEQLATSREVYCALPRRDRWGLSWTELHASKHYRVILAIPLRTGTPGALRVVGCLSVDVKEDGHVDALRKLLEDDSFNLVLSVCDAVLGRRD